MGYTLYIVACADGSLYTGIAVDLERRLSEHNGEKGTGAKGRGARYTAARRPVRLVYQAQYPTRSDALKAEIGIKRLSRDQKQRLIAGHALSSTRDSSPAVRQQCL